ncbi:RILP-like protein homolog [Anopheles maculipalpis]|uniref:RILP-like protein homolog n=1 Tax=Anopheles maculipalpis TaxID=1496333 RepID=UPI002159A762|nr:RILP-like protein homolog [Anopheles maculipalpis]
MNAAEKLTVVDVYDLALEIGKEFETIIDANGVNAVSGLITKVVNALELMETLTCQNETVNATLQELQEKIAQLEAEKEQKAASRSRYEKELEAIEDQWRTEAKELFKVIDKLQEENRKLQRGIAQSASENTHQSDEQRSRNGAPNDDFSNGSNMSDTETSVLKKSEYKLQLSQLEEKLKRKEMELCEKMAEIESLSSQNDRLKKVVSESRRRQKLSHNQIITLCEERADFLAQIQDQHHEIRALRMKLGLAEKENEDLANRVNEDERPRFSTVELKEMLTDRNELKARVSDLEQELMTCQAVGIGAENGNVNASVLEKEPSSSNEGPVVDFSELPVQGPLPYEPDDAPWKKSNESGIRKFFRKLFNETSSDCSSFSQRSLSTLSKMALSSGPHSDIPI